MRINSLVDNLHQEIGLTPTQIRFLRKQDNWELTAEIISFWSTSDKTDEAKAFTKEAIEVLKDGGEVDFKNEIIKDKSFIGTKADCVLNSLIATGNNLFKRTSQAFTDGKSKFRLKFIVKELRDDGRIAETPLPNDDGIIEIRFDPDYVNSETAIETASTILHESIHAELHRIKLTNNSGPNALPNHLFKWYMEIWRNYEQIYSYQGLVASGAEHYYEVYIKKENGKWVIDKIENHGVS